MSESSSGPSASDASSADSDASSARDAEMQTRIAASPFALSQEPVTPEGEADAPAAGSVPAPAYEHLGELPSTYGTQSVYLVAYDPHRLFAYWDVDWTSAGKTPTGYALHVCRPDGEVESQTEISSADAGRYLAVTKPGGTYYVELGRRGRDGSWQPLAFSGRVTMPPAGLSGETEAKFATLPFHLSFQRLLELIQTTMGRGEDLTAALARLQRGDHPATTASLLHTLGGLNGEQLHTLELLLGQKFNVSSAPEAGGSSGENAVLRDRHEALSSGGGFGSEALSSPALGGGSENLSSGGFGSEHGSIHAPGAGAALGGGSETLSSGLLAAGGAFGSEQLSSGGMSVGGPLSGGGSETLSSGLFAAGGLGGVGGGSETLSSGGGFGSETFSAFVAGLSSETLSSFGLSSEMLAAATTAGGSEGLSSAAWRMASTAGGVDSAGMDSERAEMFRRALGSNLDTLSSLFSAVSSGLSSGFSPGGSSGDLTSPGEW